MIVYRLMNRKELNLYISGDMENIGKFFPNQVLPNNHDYIKSKKYVHMFKRLKDKEFIEFERDFEYLVTFDIPMVVLMASNGEGLYKKLKNGKFKYRNIKEFAIKSQDIKPEYFIGFEEIDTYKPDFKQHNKLFKKSKKISSDKELCN